MQAAPGSCRQPRGAAAQTRDAGSPGGPRPHPIPRRQLALPAVGGGPSGGSGTSLIMTTLAEEKVIDSAAFITKWAGHFSRNNATYLEEKDYCEKNNLNVNFNKCKNDEASHEATINEINKADCSDFIFVIYEPTDSTGHDLGFTFNNPKYKEAFKQADTYGYEAIKAIEARETYETEDWLIIVTSDHGGIDTNHGGASIQERMTFAVMNTDF